VFRRFFGISAAPTGVPLDAAAPRPQSASRDKSRESRVPPLDDESRQRTMHALAVIEPALHEVDDMRDRLRRVVGYVSNSNEPLTVSTTMTGPSGCAHNERSKPQSTQRPQEKESLCELCDLRGLHVTSSLRRLLHADARAVPANQGTRRSADRSAGRRSGPTSRDTD